MKRMRRIEREGPFPGLGFVCFVAFPAFYP